MRTPRRMDVTLTLLGPILTRGGQQAEPGIDAPAARDARGRVMLPYSLVKGKVLDALRELRPNDFVWNPVRKEYGPKDDRRPGELPPELVDWFGKNPGVGSWEPERGRLRFTDFVTEEPGRPGDAVIERIQLDHETGATAGRMLAMIGAPFGYGQPVVFTGAVEFLATDVEAAAIRRELERAFRWVPAYGALRTVGFGRTKTVAVADPRPAPERMRGAPRAGVTLPVRLTPDRPLCLVGRKHSRNHFECLETIPGAVLKGAVARLLLDLARATTAVVDQPPPPETTWPTLWAHFAAVRFAEARPMPKGAKTRPVEPPLSLVRYPDIYYPDPANPFFDVALFTDPEKPFADEALDAGRTVRQTKQGWAAPTFDVDWKWKDGQAVRTAFGWHDVPRERRTRTAIDAKTGRAAESQLFSYDLVLPAKGDKAFVWETEIGLAGVPDEADRDRIRQELADLLAHGLPNLGKTRATAGVEWLPARTPPAVADGVPPPDGLHVVTLQTDFLMTDPDRFDRTDASKHPQNLADAYREFWHEASGEAFELVRYFARQSLHGGYLSKRFGKERNVYEPFLVTDHGSTFVLKATGDPATVLARWRAAGLPVPKWVETRYGAAGRPLWQTCPFLPHVGFGEVAIDLAVHTSHRVPA